MNAVELVNAPREPIRWVADGLFRPGFTCIAGLQSAGKSSVALNMTVDITEGRPLFGHFAVPEARPALIVSTEEQQEDMARYVERAYRVRGLGLNPNLHFYRTIPPAAAGGIDELEQLVADLQPGIVLIDVFYNDFVFLPPSAAKSRAAMAAWNARGVEWDCAIVGTWHSWRRGIPATGPWMHTVLGSSGALSAMIVRTGLARLANTNKSVLRVTGKGTKDIDLELVYDDATGMFSAADATEATTTPDGTTIRRELIMAVITEAGAKGIRAVEIAPLVRTLAIERHAPVDPDSLNYDSLRQIMYQMFRDATFPLERLNGVYYHADAIPKVVKSAAA